MGAALPWTLALLGMATAIAFSLGIFLGGLLAWPKTARFLVNVLLPPFLTLSAVPYYMLGLVLLWGFAFQFHWFSIFGAYTPWTSSEWSCFGVWKDSARTFVRPSLSVGLSSLGFSGLGIPAW